MEKYKLFFNPTLVGRLEYTLPLPYSDPKPLRTPFKIAVAKVSIIFVTTKHFNKKIRRKTKKSSSLSV